MFEENRNNIEQDQLFRSILEDGIEPAPAHVWDRIEADLDKIAQRRRTILWFRRTAIGVAAAAALTLGLFFDYGREENLVSPVASEGMIAVVQTQNPEAEEVHEVSEMAKAPKLVAMARTENGKPSYEASTESPLTVTEVTEAQSSEDVPTEPQKEEGKPVRSAKAAQDNQEYSDAWMYEAPSKEKKGISFTVSGITGTNSTQNSNRVNPMMRPGISAAPDKTGIKETSTNTSYGIPVSAGAGIKIGFAPKWSVGLGLNYSLLSRKFYGTYTQVGENKAILKDISSDIRENQHYIGVPVNLYYDIVNNDKVSLYAYAGGTAEKCVADKFQVMDTDIIHTEKVKGMQLSTNLGMGVEFLVGKHLGIYLDPSLRYYFDNGQPKSIRTVQPLMFGFEMGLRARL